MTDYLAHNGKPWSPEDLEALAKVYPDTDNATLGRIFRRSESSIQNQATNHGWRKSAAHMAKNPGCFKPGLTPWNKGTHYVAPGSEHTRFRKGQKPHTWQPIGSERVTKDGYLQRKMTDTGYPPRDWVPVSHIEWEKHHGKPVPEGHAIVFRDGNSRNFAPSNLELISRADLMRRNSYLNLPEPLPQIVQLRGALNRKINRRSQQA
ncbi:HNH endonuclease signature motif containing protein [Vreelandella olivaria]|uniref:HNH endonuclease signature motif containing protein n=1 Tax=Vreelandella olivaria TaxID=390919 RepID=UPI00201EA99F|nr:HNH endonuclease signature motif containing protein [Halomonas olivaria]